MISLETAEQLIDLGARIDDPVRAEEQLRGALALHAWLEQHQVAYLADEVGLGKTYVALATIALFRHFDPGFRVLVLAPRANIQKKWRDKEWRNFVRYNMNFADLRVRGFGEQPARQTVHCEDLLELVREATLDPNRDFFGRLTSFSLGYQGEDEARALVKRLQGHLPWVDASTFNYGDRLAFKDEVARTINCALPVFDLVVVDEAHNLKHGFSKTVAARNRVLALTLGHPSETPDPMRFPGYGIRARRVLLLSATPTDRGYGQIWNQLDVVGKGAQFRGLIDDTVPELEKRDIIRQFLLRRVNTVRGLTKNQYRREWRKGGVEQHDEPIQCQDDRQRLTVALMQKKVTELLDDPRFGASFQIGMLASFESFLQTAQVRRDSQDELPSAFDDADQADNVQEREGIDVHEVNRIAHSHRRRFGQELAHPKMDAMVARLCRAWTTGEKHLVFVRRIASVTDLKRKLDDAYDLWLHKHLRTLWPGHLHAELDRLVAQHAAEKMAHRAKAEDAGGPTGKAEDPGGIDTFFAWFYRGEGPKGIVSAAAIQKRFQQAGSRLGLFFEDNHVAALLAARPGGVLAALARATGLEVSAARAVLRRLAARFLGPAKRLLRGDLFAAAQAAAVEMLADSPGTWQQEAKALVREVFQAKPMKSGMKDSPDVADMLEEATFFTELRQRPALRETLWPDLRLLADPAARVREVELRTATLASAARLGHAYIDLHALVIANRKSLVPRDRLEDADDGDAQDAGLIGRYLDLLESQRVTPVLQRTWGAWDELADISCHFKILMAVNLPKAQEEPLPQLATNLGRLMREQQPVAGMSGRVNGTAVGQFRMPGYPFIMVSTDLLQEGEDLHTFCSSVHHYGLSWTPSSMEQRIGRVDRVRSATDRRLRAGSGAPPPEDLLQVHYPHLQDTVEVLQVQEVLRRMDAFLRLMHEGLGREGEHQNRRLDVTRALGADSGYPAPIEGTLHTAFPIPEASADDTITTLAVLPAAAGDALARFHALADRDLRGVEVVWNDPVDPSRPVRYATVRLGSRQQPVILSLHAIGKYLVVRCKSPVGRVLDRQDQVLRLSLLHARVGLVEDGERYDLAVEDDVFLAEVAHDSTRVGSLLARVARQADELEQAHLREQDQPLAAFIDQLAREAEHA